MTNGTDGADAAGAEAAGSAAPEDATSAADGGAAAEANAGGAPNGGTHAQTLVLTTVVPAALDVGWTMAVLFGHLRADADEPTDRLPTEHELGQTHRRSLEIDRLDCSLTALSAAIPTDAHEIPDGIPQTLRNPPQPAAGGDPFAAALQTANRDLLSALACAGRSVELAYEVGRSLRNTVCPPRARPNDPASFEAAAIEQLSRQRTSKLTQWISSLDPFLPGDSGKVVSASLGRWSTFVTTVLNRDAPGSLSDNSADNRAALARRAEVALLDQGDVWLGFLTGAESTAGLLTPEAYVAAGEAALSRTVRIVRRVILHYWVALFVVALALAAILYVSARYLGGASKVWTQIAAIATSLGVSAKGIGNAVAHLSEAAERPIYRAEELDALAWAVTSLPSVKLNNQGVRVLRHAGIRPSQPLGRS